jgi:hypothetical protein
VSFIRHINIFEGFILYDFQVVSSKLVGAIHNVFPVPSALRADRCLSVVYRRGKLNPVVGRTSSFTGRNFQQEPSSRKRPGGVKEALCW